MKRFCCLIVLLAAMLTPLAAFAAPDDVIARIDDLTITEQELTDTAYNLYYYGIAESENDYRFALDYLLRNQKAPLIKAKTLGLDQMDAEERNSIEQKAEAVFEYYIGLYISENIKQGVPDTEENRTLLRTEALDYWASYGMTKEYYVDSYVTQAILEKLNATMDLSYTQAELDALRASLCASDKERYGGSLRAYEYALYQQNATLWYRPEGYRYAELLYLPTPGEPLNAWIAASRKDAPSADAARAAVIGAVQGAADDIMLRLQAGETLDAIRSEYPAPKAVSDLRQEDGYLIHPQSVVWDAQIIDAAFPEDIPSPGSLLGTAVTEDGAVMVFYLGDSYAGDAPLDDLLLSALAEQMRDRKKEEYLGLWLSECSVTVNEEALLRMETEGA